MPHTKLIRTIAFLLWSVAATTSLPAAVLTWTGGGGANANWNSSANWGGAGTPAYGDTLVFPGGAPNLVNTNNIVGLTLNQVRFTGASGGYSIVGNSFTLTNSLVATNTLGSSTLGNDITLSTTDITVTVSNSLLLAGALSGGVGLTKNGAGTLALSGATPNTYGGVTRMNEGTLQLNKTAVNGVPGALVIGDDLGGVNADVVQWLSSNQINSGAAITISSSGLLDLNGHNATLGPFTLTAGNIATGTGTLTLNGDVTANSTASAACSISGHLDLGAVTRTFNNASGTRSPSLVISADITGAGGLTKAGTLGLELDSSNSYAGLTVVAAGTLTIFNAFALGTTNAGTVVSNGAALSLGANGLNVGREALTISGTGVSSSLGAFWSGNNNNTSWAGDIALAGDTVIGVVGNSGQFTLTGVISGPGGLSKTNSGALTLAGAGNSYTGVTRVSSGTLLINDGQPASSVTVAGGILGGSGVCGPLTALGGSVSPGSSPGILSVSGGGQMLLTNPASYTVEINGSSPGSGYDQLAVAGTINLANSGISLSLSPSFTPAFGQTFTIIANDGLDPVTGTFSGQPEGSTLQAGGFQFVFSYAGNSGNDVVLTAQALVTGAIKVWSGAGANSLWSNPFNWVGNLAPNPGDVLVFPPAAARAVNTNDFPSPTSFYGFTLGGSDYFLFGNPITLSGGINATNTTGTNTLLMNLQLPGNAFISCLTPPTSVHLQGVLGGPGGLTKEGPGTLRLEGSAANTYSGLTLVNAGTLELGKTGTPAVHGNLTVGDGMGGPDVDVVRLTAPAQIDFGSAVTVRYSGLLDLNGFNNTFGSLTILGGDVNSGTATLGVTGPIITGVDPVTNVATAGILGKLTLSSPSQQFVVSNLTDCDVVANVIGSGGLVKSGLGSLRFESSNSYAGLTVVSEGKLYINDSSALGTTAGGTTVSNGASLVVFNSIQVGNETLQLSGPGSDGGGALRVALDTNSWSGPVTLVGDSTITVAFANVALTLSNSISGPGKLIKSGPGLLTFEGTNNNTYAGGTFVNEGTLVLNRGVPSAVSIPGNLDIAGTVRTLRQGQLAPGVDVTIQSSGLLDIAPPPGQSGELFASLSGSGGVALTLQQTVTVAVGNNNASSTYDGVISGPGGFEKVGTGTFLLTGANTYTGGTLVNAGTLLVNGFQPQSPVLVEPNATLGGTGTVGTLTLTTNGTLSPGPGPGILNCSNVTFNPGANYVVELNGTNAGTDYDQLNVTGTVSLGNAALNVVVGYTPTPLDTFVIINNDGADVVTSPFNLPPGTDLVTNNMRFGVSYSGGTGNDVVLTALPIRTGVQKFWTGAGINGFWSNPANWSQNVAPVAGDDLFFRVSAARRINTNDFPSGTSFNQVIIDGSNYVMSGSSVYLNNTFQDNSYGATNYFNCPIIVGSSLFGFNCGGGSHVYLEDDLDVGTYGAFVYSFGDLTIGGKTSGSGGITKSASGDLTLIGSNSYSGLTVVSEGRIVVANAAALGAASGGTVVSNGATLELVPGVRIANEPLTLNGPGLPGLGALVGDAINSWAGPISLTGDSTIIVLTNGVLSLSNSISGAGQLTKNGPGTLKLAGPGANTFGGGVVVNEGILTLAKTAGANALPGPLIIGDGLGGPNADVVRLEASNQISDLADVTVNSSGLLDLAGFSEAIGSLGGLGNVQLGDGTLDTGTNNASKAFSGIISGPQGNLIKSGSGFFALQGNNTYSGLTTIRTGTLEVDGSQPASPVAVSSGATLKGVGVVGNTTASGLATISPGDSPGILTCSNVGFSSAGTFNVELNGTTAGAGYDQLQAFGPVSLAGVLALTLGFSPALGDTFTIVSNNSGMPITGTFTGLAQNVVFSTGGTPWQINYSGGSGNDVVLTRVRAPAGQITNFAATATGALIQGSGLSNVLYTIQASTNLASADWVNLGQTLPDFNGAFSFTDTNAALFSDRFYRVLSP
jgi:autotransporter-associated beta strand protein